jgi:hypothetical protein
MKQVKPIVPYLGKYGISTGILLDMDTRIITPCRRKALR